MSSDPDVIEELVAEFVQRREQDPALDAATFAAGHPEDGASSNRLVPVRTSAASFMMRAGRAFTPRRVEREVARGHALRNQLVEQIGPKGVLLYPSQPRPAPRHGRPLLRPFGWVYTGIFNVIELPATQVPLGLGSEGLPLGVQVAAVHGN